ncbi:MAG: hypothetical protein HUU38_00045 [Anaerolineales bacterium]|nr:hypothetical protein [Anaerolineales bacterium]
MATTSSFTISRTEKKPALQGAGYDWAQVVLQLLFLGGLFVDGWAHFHGKVDDSFFTRWHAMFYGSFGLCAGVLIGTMVVNRARGYLGRAMLPTGYDLTLLGTVVFAGGGVADMFWHIAFGIEQDTEALLSPSHLLLAAGMFLTMSGPLRAAWSRRGTHAPFSAILSLSLTLTGVTFITSYANPIVDFYFNGTEMVTAIMLTTALTMGFVLLAMRRWTLKPGSLTVLFTLNAAFMSVLQDQYPLILAWFAAGVLADGLYAFLRPEVKTPVRVRWFAFWVPVSLFGAYFLTLFWAGDLHWRIHTWGGGIVLAGVVGLFLSYLLVPPAVPGEDK